MPLPTPIQERELLHTRTITFKGYRRKDNLWDVEGHLLDVRPKDVHYPGGSRVGGEPVHSMWLRLTVDASYEIRAVQASSDAVPYQGVCGTITSHYAELVGVRIGKGFGAEVRRLVGGKNGCAHMTELLLSMGTAVMQTLNGEVASPPEQKPFALDGCHALDTSGPLVATFHPRWYRPKDESVANSGAASGTADGSPLAV